VPHLQPINTKHSKPSRVNDRRLKGKDLVSLAFFFIFLNGLLQHSVSVNVGSRGDGGNAMQ